MPTPDFSNMSDEDLQAMVSGKPQQTLEKPEVAPNAPQDFSKMSNEDLQSIVSSPSPKGTDFSKMSDEDLMKIATPPKAKEEVSPEEAAARGAYQGFTFNFERPISAAAAASPYATESQKTGTMPNINPVDIALGAGKLGLQKFAPETFGTDAQAAYEKRYALESERNKAAEAAHPYITTGTELLGASLNPVNYLIPEAKIGETMLQGAARVGLPSAAMGAAGGYGEGDSTSP